MLPALSRRKTPSSLARSVQRLGIAVMSLVADTPI